MDPTYRVHLGQRRNRNTCLTAGCRATGLRCLDGLCDPCYQARLASTPVPVCYGVTWDEYMAMTPAQRRQLSRDERPESPVYTEDYRAQLQSEMRGGPG